MKRWLLSLIPLMTLSSSAFAQTGADSDIFYNARIVFSDQHTMYFQLALGPGQGASQGSCLSSMAKNGWL